MALVLKGLSDDEWEKIKKGETLAVYSDYKTILIKMESPLLLSLMF